MLRSIELFSDLGDEVLEQLLDQSRSLDLVRGDVIFAEGSEADALYVVESGRIAIGNKSFDGRESMVALMTHGDLFGEMSLFDKLGRSAEARALEPSEVVEIPYRPLIDLWEHQPELLWKVIGLLTKRLRNMDEALADSFFLDGTGRTAKHLLELAGLVGASRERVNKAISSFVKLEWIDQNDRTYRILKRRELEIRAM